MDQDLFPVASAAMKKSKDDDSIAFETLQKNSRIWRLADEKHAAS